MAKGNHSQFSGSSKVFLETFERTWRSMLNDMNCAHAQLVMGSRLRPQIAYWGYLANIHDKDDIKYDLIAHAASSIELIHKASLLIDDWIDGDAARHGENAFHISHGPQYAVVMAVYLVSESLRRLKQVLPLDMIPPTYHYLCIDLLAETVHSMSAGVLEELRLSDDGLYDIETVKRIAHLETAEILGNGMLLGYYVGGGSDDNVTAIFKTIGDQCGYLFQTMNDLEAFSSASSNIDHKGALNFDIEEKRKNIPVAKLYQIASSKDKYAIMNGDSDVILRFFKKYRIVDMVMSDMEIVYGSILRSIKGLKFYGLSTDWIEGFEGFMRMLRSVAEQRLM